MLRFRFCSDSTVEPQLLESTCDKAAVGRYGTGRYPSVHVNSRTSRQTGPITRAIPVALPTRQDLSIYGSIGTCVHERYLIYPATQLEVYLENFLPPPNGACRWRFHLEQKTIL